jgi:hypothetical protein
MISTSTAVLQAASTERRSVMRYSSFVLPVVVLTAFGLLTANALAQEGSSPPPNAAPGAVGVSGRVLGEPDCRTLDLLRDGR